jgi:hypothetical protein
MSNPLRSEVGALGFVRQNGLQRNRSSFRGIGGRPQGLDEAPLPNHAPQRPSPRPWATDPQQQQLQQLQQQQQLNGAAARGVGAVVSNPAGPGAPLRGEAPGPVLGAGSKSIGSFIRASPGGGLLRGGASPAEGEATASPGDGAAPAAPAAPAAAAAAVPAAAVTTLAALAGFTPDAELREDLAACKSRLDAAGLRLSGQDNAVKALERSVAALREEYTKVSQATDAQSVLRLEACERALGRLDAGFQEFSSRFQRELRSAEQSFAEVGGVGGGDAQVPLPCRLLQDEPDGLRALETVHLFLPMHRDEAGVPCLHRKRFSPRLGAVRSSSFRLQEPDGEPRVCFV